jgi:LuxR family maltose regulon positive regulatory protein
VALMRGFPLIHTKIMNPPVRSGLVERTRLVQQINTGLSCGFVLLSAPPGYGKTTLLSAWARRQTVPWPGCRWTNTTTTW